MRQVPLQVEFRGAYFVIALLRGSLVGDRRRLEGVLRDAHRAKTIRQLGGMGEDGTYAIMPSTSLTRQLGIDRVDNPQAPQKLRQWLAEAMTKPAAVDSPIRPV